MSSGMTSDLDGSGNNDYFEVFVEGHGTTKYTSAGKRWANGGQSVTMSSYLRIGAPTSTSGQETATKYGDDLARKAISYKARTQNQIDANKGEFEADLIEKVFVDDDRKRTADGTYPSNDPDDNGDPKDTSSKPKDWQTQDERLEESQMLFSRGGWRDHSDGNRVTTTRGDKLEVIRGNYKLMVLGRVDEAEFAAEEDWSGGIHCDADRAPGSMEVKWVTDQDNTWKLIERTTAAEIDIKVEGHTKEIHKGKFEEYFGGGDYKSWVGHWEGDKNMVGTDDKAGAAEGGVDHADFVVAAVHIDETEIGDAAITRKITAPFIVETWTGIYAEAFFGNKLEVHVGFTESVFLGLETVFVKGVTHEFRVPLIKDKLAHCSVAVGDYYELASDEHYSINKNMYEIAMDKVEYFKETRSFKTASKDVFANADSYGLGMKAMIGQIQFN